MTTGASATAARDGVDGVTVVEHPELVAHAVVVVGVRRGLVVGRVKRCRQPVSQRQSPDGGEVGPRGPEQIEPVALGLGQRLLVGQDVAFLSRVGETERPNHSRRGPTGGVGHPIGIEARPRVGAQGPVGLPAREEVGGHLIAVSVPLEVGLGQLDQDGVGRMARGEMHPFGRADDVIRRRHDLADGYPGGVAQASERFESWHGATLAHQARLAVTNSTRARRDGHRRGGLLPYTGSVEQQDGLSRVLTAPNVITLVRLLCIPVFLWLLFGLHRQTAAAVLLAALGTTDWIDGYVARRYHQVSTLGKILDPAADRLLVGTAVIAVIVHGAVPLWFGLATIVREALVSVMVLLLAALGAARINVLWVGKAGTFGLMFAYPAFLLSTALPRGRDQSAWWPGSAAPSA